MSKVIAHVAGPSGSGKTELVNVLSPLVKKLILIDLDIFDEEAMEITKLVNLDKNDYTDEQLLLHHCVKQELINYFIKDNALSIIFFGHIEEAGNIIALPDGIAKLLLVNVLQGAFRRGRHSNLFLEEIMNLVRQGEQDVAFSKDRGYSPIGSRGVYRKALTWNEQEE